MGRTCLHSQETRPGIVGGGVAEPSDEAEDETEEVGVSGRDGLRPERGRCRCRRLFLTVGLWWVRGQGTIAIGITVGSLEIAIIGFDVGRGCHSCVYTMECWERREVKMEEANSAVSEAAPTDAIGGNRQPCRAERKCRCLENKHDDDGAISTKSVLFSRFIHWQVGNSCDSIKYLEVGLVYTTMLQWSR